MEKYEFKSVIDKFTLVGIKQCTLVNSRGKISHILRFTVNPKPDVMTGICRSAIPSAEVLKRVYKGIELSPQKQLPKMLARIANNELKLGFLSKMAGVSTMTFRKYIANGHVSQKTCALIERNVKEAAQRLLEETSQLIVYLKGLQA